MSAPLAPTDGRVGAGEVLGLAWPIIVSMLSYTLMSIADTLFIGRLGTPQLAAVGLAIATVYVFHGFINGVFAGLKVTVAQATGAKEDDRARRLGWQGLWLAAVLGLGELALYPFADAVFAIHDASPEVRAHAAAYFEVRVLGAPLICGMAAATAYFHGRGHTRLPMVATILANVVNVSLDPILIFGWGPVPAMGMAGAALATVIACGLGLAFLLVWLLPALRDSPARLDRALLGTVWRFGYPLGVRIALEVGSFLAFAGILAVVGEDHLAAHVIVIRILSFSFLPGYAIHEAAAILVGQAVGAGRRWRAVAIQRTAARVAMVIMTGCGLVFVVLPGPLTAIFDASEEVAALARVTLLVAAGFQIFDALALVAQGVLNGLGDTRFVMVSSVTAAWLIKVPLGWALAVPAGLGVAGAWLGLTVEVIVIAAISVWRTRRLLGSEAGSVPPTRTQPAPA